MSAPQFGIINTRPDDEPIPVIGADFSKIGLVETSEDADAAVFPLNTPVRFASNDPAFLSKIGTGYLADALRGINAQLGPLGAAADVTIVRVAEGASAVAQTKLEQTTANIIGTAAAKTGLYALKAAPEAVGATPRLIWAGRTAWQPDANSANPIIAELPAILNSLLAVAVADAPDGSRDAALAWRETTQSERIIPVSVAARVYEGANVVTRPMAPRLLGIVVRGEVGVDTAIADGGFVYIGTESCAEGDLWSQFHQVRGSDYLTVKMMRITRQFLGKLITADLVEAWINSIKFMLRDHKAANDIHYEFHLDNQELWYRDFYEREGRSGGASWFAAVRQALGG